jgi:hypothetical protein
MRRVLGLAAVALLLSSCSELAKGRDWASSPPHDVRAAIALWHERGVHNYSMTLNRVCFCRRGPDRVTVLNDKVVEVGGPAGKATGLPLEAEQGLSVVGLLDQIADLGDRVSEVSFDPHYGYPTHVSADPMPNAIDDEFRYEITSFTPKS